MQVFQILLYFKKIQVQGAEAAVIARKFRGYVRIRGKVREFLGRGSVRIRVLLREDSGSLP